MAVLINGVESPCCSAKVVKEFRIELYHGADDEYELNVPFFICIKCGEPVSLLQTADMIGRGKKDA